MSQRLSFFSQPEKPWQVKPDRIYIQWEIAGTTQSASLNEKPRRVLCPCLEQCHCGPSRMGKLHLGWAALAPRPRPGPCSLLSAPPLLLGCCHTDSQLPRFEAHPLPSLFLALSHILVFPGSLFARPCCFICYFLRKLMTNERGVLNTEIKCECVTPSRKHIYS